MRFNAHLAGENGTAGGHGAGLHGPPSERVVAKPEIRSPAKPETRGLTRKLMPVAQIGNLSVAVEIVASRAKFAAGVVARASRPCVPARFHDAKPEHTGETPVPLLWLRRRAAPYRRTAFCGRRLDRALGKRFGHSADSQSATQQITNLRYAAVDSSRSPHRQFKLHHYGPAPCLTGTVENQRLPPSNL